MQMKLLTKPSKKAQEVKCKRVSANRYPQSPLSPPRRFQ